MRAVLCFIYVGKRPSILHKCGRGLLRADREGDGASWQLVTPYLFDKPQFEKPIVIYWLLRVAYMLFGVLVLRRGFFQRYLRRSALSQPISWAYFYSGTKRNPLFAVSSWVRRFCIPWAGQGAPYGMVFSVLVLLSLLSFFWGYCVRKGALPVSCSFLFFRRWLSWPKGRLDLSCRCLRPCYFC